VDFELTNLKGMWGSFNHTAHIDGNTLLDLPHIHSLYKLFAHKTHIKGEMA
jgi:hypothetical protein